MYLHHTISTNIYKSKHKKQYTMKAIHLASKHHKILQSEFSEVSRQTIHTALKYFNNSETAVKIRARALELLNEEIKTNN